MGSILEKSIHYCILEMSIEGLKPTSRNNELIFRKRNPLAVLLDRASEFNVGIMNLLFLKLLFLKRLASSSFK